ncbi:MAG: RsmE family RNA methyltransferase [Bacillota bacterium]
MRRFTVKKENIFETEAFLDFSERSHIVNVLRMKVGDKLIATDGEGRDFVCEIAEISEESVKLAIIEETTNNADPKYDITIFQAAPKRDKLELIIQKATEIGLSRLVPFQSKFCISKFDNDKIARLSKISAEATKQCGRSIPLEICNVQTFGEMIISLSKYECVIFAYEKATSSLKEAINEYKNSNNGGKIAIVIGSEGGFSKEEAEKIANLANVKCISLGSRILRLETAAISLSAIISYELEN